MGKGRPKNIQLRAKIASLRANGLTYLQIEKELGCGDKTITRTLREHKIPVPMFVALPQPFQFAGSGLPTKFSLRAQACLKNGTNGNGGNDTLYKMGEQIEKLGQQLKALGTVSRTLGS